MTQKTDRALGLASLAIGAAELAAPKKIENALGISDGQNSGILRVCGVREIMQGVDILMHKNPKPGIWARVAGDVVDGVLMGMAFMKTRKQHSFAAMAAVVLGITVLDILAASKSRQ